MGWCAVCGAVLGRASISVSRGLQAGETEGAGGQGPMVGGWWDGGPMVNGSWLGTMGWRGRRRPNAFVCIRPPLMHAVLAATAPPSPKRLQAGPRRCWFGLQNRRSPHGLQAAQLANLRQDVLWRKEIHVGFVWVCGCVLRLRQGCASRSEHPGITQPHFLHHQLTRPLNLDLEMSTTFTHTASLAPTCPPIKGAR
jgi:hypothetical protein